MKAQLEIEELSDDPDDIAKVLLKLRHECERSLDNISKNINDGKSIVQHMKANAQDGKNESRDRLQEIIKDLEGKKNVLEMAWMRRREQMELWQQLWEFERDGENVSSFLLTRRVIFLVQSFLESLFSWKRCSVATWGKNSKFQTSHTLCKLFLGGGGGKRNFCS